MKTTEIRLGDCFAHLAKLPDKCSDLILCDPPYGTTAAGWDAALPAVDMWLEFSRVCKGPIVLFAAQPFTSHLICSNPRGFSYCWTWDKSPRFSGHLNANRQPLRATEDVCVFYATPDRYFPQLETGAPYSTSSGRGSGLYGGQQKAATENGGTRHPKNVLRFLPPGRPRVHPTQKPVDLLAYLIRTYTRPGALVIDPTMGSGSTGVAAVREGRKFFGVEKDPQFFASAESRLIAALRTLRDKR